MGKACWRNVFFAIYRIAIESTARGRKKILDHRWKDLSPYHMRRLIDKGGAERHLHQVPVVQWRGMDRRPSRTLHHMAVLLRIRGAEVPTSTCPTELHWFRAAGKERREIISLGSQRVMMSSARLHLPDFLSQRRVSHPHTRPQRLVSTGTVSPPTGDSFREWLRMLSCCWSTPAPLVLICWCGFVLGRDGLDNQDNDAVSFTHH